MGVGGVWEASALQVACTGIRYIKYEVFQYLVRRAVQRADAFFKPHRNISYVLLGASLVAPTRPGDPNASEHSVEASELS